jgi:hypothetical protein
MSSRVTPADESIIADLMEIGDFGDSTQVIHEALIAFARQVRHDRLRELVKEGEDAYERGDFVEATPEYWDQLQDEAHEMVRLGLPLEPDVCG